MFSRFKVLRLDSLLFDFFFFFKEFEKILACLSIFSLVNQNSIFLYL